MMNWWDRTTIDSNCYDIERLAVPMLFDHVLKTEGTVHEKSWVDLSFDDAQVRTCLETLGFRRCSTQHTDDGSSNCDYVGAHGFVHLNLSPLNENNSIRAYVLREDVLAQLSEAVKAARREGGTRVFMLKQERDELRFSQNALRESTFEPGNYSEAVVKQYAFVRSVLAAKEPLGRLILLNGEPGTGKSHFIRALLTELRKTVAFCAIPPSFVEELTGPALIGAVDNFRTWHSRGPFAAVIEDADVCLVRRSSDNISVIAGLLNMTDGLVGEIIDARIIATTNAKKLEIDPALLRPGRLAVQIDFEKLDEARANAVLERLGVKERVSKPTTLAELYARAAEKETP